MEPLTYKKPKPRISLDETELPAIKSWEVGKTYTVTAKVKMVHQAEGDEYGYSRDDSEEKPKMRATLKVISITPEKDMKKKVGKMYVRKSR